MSRSRYFVPELFEETPVPDSYDTLFAAPESSLPGPLPTIGEILQCTNPKDKIDWGWVKPINGNYVVKYGPLISRVEADTMRFVRENTDVRCPQVYAVYRQQLPTGREMVYIVMENIPGETLDAKWATMTDAEKDDVIRRLHQCILTLRKLTNPSGHFESVGHASLQNVFFRSPAPQKHLSGPFEDEESFVSGLLAQFHLAARVRIRADIDQMVREELFTGEPPVFTHGNTLARNVILTPQDEIVLVNWGSAGWYPAYWEYLWISDQERASREDDYYIRLRECMRENFAKITMLEFLLHHMVPGPYFLERASPDK